MSLYQTLEVSANARPEAIRAAYKRLMQRYHPDKNAGEPAAEKKAQQIAQAFRILSDPALRAQYDLGKQDAFPELSPDTKSRFPRLNRAVWTKAAVVVSCLVVAVTASVLYRSYEEQQRIAQQQLEQIVAMQKKQREDDDKKRQEQEALDQMKAAAHADARDKTRRTVPVFDTHRFVALRDKGPVQGFILPPVDVVVGKDSSERTAHNISAGRAGLRKAVLKELAELSAKDLKTATAEGAVSASVMKALNGSILGAGREAQICRKDFDEYVCRGIETVILRGSVELVPG